MYRIVMLIVALLLGPVLLAMPTAANATADKPWICHKVNGQGETGTRWNLINPEKASSHIDESGQKKNGHEDDVYATVVNGKQTCPGETPESEPTATFPSWRIPYGCDDNGSWYQIISPDTDTYTVSYVARGRAVDFTFTVKPGYIFIDGPDYDISDDGMYAYAREFIVIPRCGHVVPDPDPQPDPDKPDKPTPNDQPNKPTKEQPSWERPLPNTGAGSDALAALIGLASIGLGGYLVRKSLRA